MQPSEMTNEELANLIGEGGGTSLMDHAVREAVARLRTFAVREIAHRASVEAFRREVKDLNSKRQAKIYDLRRRLKVAEDALTELQSRLVASVHDGTMNPYEALEITERAIAAISEKGGAK